MTKDTAKTTFDARKRVSSIDLNRAGTGLMEIVSKPDMRYMQVASRLFLSVLTVCFRSPEEAADYVRTLQSLLRAVGASDGNMEQAGIVSLTAWTRADPLNHGYRAHYDVMSTFL